MIKISARTVLSAVKKTFVTLYEQNEKPSDPELWREKTAIVIVNGPDKKSPSLGFEKNRFICNFDYVKYFPYVKQKTIDIELKYWYSEFISPPRMSNLISYLRKNPQSKRAIINLWRNKHRNLNLSVPCATHLFFRIKKTKLEMHSHLRANNASFLILMDFHILSGVQQIIADKLRLKKGNYVHIVDSLHFYKKELKTIKKQYRFMKKSELWKAI